MREVVKEPAVQEALGVSGHEWTSCNFEVAIPLIEDWVKNLEPLIPKILANGQRVLIYSGMNDWICNCDRFPLFVSPLYFFVVADVAKGSEVRHGFQQWNGLASSSS